MVNPNPMWREWFFCLDSSVPHMGSGSCFMGLLTYQIIFLAFPHLDIFQEQSLSDLQALVYLASIASL